MPAEELTQSQLVTRALNEADLSSRMASEIGLKLEGLAIFATAS